MKRLQFGLVDPGSRVFFAAGAIFCATLIIAFVGESLFFRNTPVPTGGQLDLRNWDFSASGMISLGGTWAFEPEKLVTSQEFDQTKSVLRRVPDTRFARRGGSYFSGTGSGTYRLEVLLPPRDQDLGIRFSTIWTAFDLVANGIVVKRVGIPGISPQQSEPGFAAGVVSLGPTADKLEILVRVSNNEYRWGGIVQPLVLGNVPSLVTQKRWDDMVVFLMVGALLGVAANALFLFAYRRRDSVYFYFTAFALTVALRALTSGDGLISGLFPGLGFDAFVRMGYTSQYLIMPTAALFFHRLFVEDVPWSALFWFLLPCLGFCLLLPFASVNVLSWSILPYSLVALGQTGYGYVAVCLKPAIKHRPGAMIVLAAGTVLLTSIVVNVVTEVFFSRAESGFPIDLAAFVIVQSLVMAKRFTWVFERSETLAEELKGANRQLMDEARAAEDARDMLEEVVKEKDVLLREVHHRVKNSLQIVLSIINLQVRRVTDPGALAAYSSVRDRIRAISSVHDRLFGLDSEKRIDLKAYCADLLRQLDDSYGNDGPLFQFESETIQVPMDLCLEIGLILTELATNSCRHANIPSQGGFVHISLRQTGHGILLTVSDDGPGFPEGFLPSGVKTVGFKIIGSMVSQRRGSIATFNNPGAVVQVQLPLSKKKDSTAATGFE